MNDESLSTIKPKRAVLEPEGEIELTGLTLIELEARLNVRAGLSPRGEL